MKALHVGSRSPGWCCLSILLLAGTPARPQTLLPLASDPQTVEFCAGLASAGAGHLLLTFVEQRVQAHLLEPDGTPGAASLDLGTSPYFPPAAAVAFTAPHYLVAWTGSVGTAYGQLLSTAGAAVGPAFVVAGGSAISPAYVRGLASNGSRFLLVLQDADPDGRGSLRGQMLDPNGSLIGGLFLLGDARGGEIEVPTVAVGGDAFLVAWQRQDPALQSGSQDKVAEAALVRLTAGGGAVSGPLRLCDQPSSDRNPLTSAFDGQRFLVVWNHSGPDDAGPGWNPEPELQLHGRFVNVAAEVEGPEMTLVAEEQSHFPALAFDGENYLMVWQGGLEGRVWRQFFSREGVASVERLEITGLPVPASPAFVLPGLLFDGTRYLAVLNLLGLEVDGGGEMIGLRSGDVYGTFVSAGTPVPGSPARLELLGWSAGEGAELRVTGTPGSPYHVESAADVKGPWTVVGDGRPGPEHVFLLTDPTAPATTRFYRAVTP